MGGIGAISKRIANPVADSQTFDITANRFDDASTFRPRRSLGYWAMLGALAIGSLVLLTGGLIPGLSRSRQAVNA